MDDGEILYLVHYYGWNVRYDEWVKADRIIWPLDKGGPKKNKRRKLRIKKIVKRTKRGMKRGRSPNGEDHL